MKFVLRSGKVAEGILKGIAVREGKEGEVKETQYWSVSCKNCNAAIPLLEYDPTKQIRNPTEFQATCRRCPAATATSVFDESELHIELLNTVPAFVPAEGFSNAIGLVQKKTK